MPEEREFAEGGLVAAEIAFVTHAMCQYCFGYAIYQTPRKALLSLYLRLYWQPRPNSFRTGRAHFTGSRAQTISVECDRLSRSTTVMIGRRDISAPYSTLLYAPATRLASTPHNFFPYSKRSSAYFFLPLRSTITDSLARSAEVSLASTSMRARLLT
jgi:hypothetical protein